MSTKISTNSLARILYLFLIVLSASSIVRAGDTIAYRLPEGHTMHFDNPSTAQQHLAAVTKLGCEVKQDQHRGHIDVSYRVSQWKSLDLKSPALAQQWEAWLKGAGFETLRGHAADHRDGSQSHHRAAGHDHDLGHGHSHSHGPGQVEQVAYRLSRWSTQHFEDPKQRQEFVALMKAFGCEVRTDSHGNHVDVDVRCRDWNHADFPSHAIAQSWETWLTKSGFEVRHQH